MLTVSTAWKKAQSLPIRPESNIKFEVLNSSGGSVSSTHYKDILSSFSYKQTSSLENKTFPTKTITMSCFKQKFDKAIGKFVKVYFCFKINGTFEEAYVGEFQITQKEEKNNSLVINYTLSSGRSYTWTGTRYPNEIYLEGSFGHQSNDGGLYIYDLARYIGVSLDSDTQTYQSTYRVARGLKQVSYAEARQSLAILCGKTLKFDIRVGGGGYRFSLVHVMDIQPTYFIQLKNCFEKPEFEVVNIPKQYKITLNYFEKSENYDVFVSSRPLGYVDTDIRLLEAGKYAFAEAQGSDTSLYAVIEDNYLRMGNTSYTEKTVRANVYYAQLSTQELTYNTITNFYTSDDVISLNNVLVASGNLPPRLADYLTTYCAKHNQLVILNMRIDPCLESLDAIYYEDENDSSKGYKAVIEDIDMTYDGSFKGTIRARKYSGDSSVNLTPTISLSSNTLTITPVGFDADEYDIYNAETGDYITTVSSNTVDLSQIPAIYDTLVISLKVKAKYGGYATDFSNTVIYAFSCIVAGLGSKEITDVSFTFIKEIPTFEEITKDGNTFIKIPKMYRKVLSVANDQITSFKISAYKEDNDFAPYPCFLQEDGTTEMDYVLVGKYYSNSDLVMNSEDTNTLEQSITSARTNAQALGSGYQLYDWQIHKLWQDLIICKKQTMDTNDGSGIGTDMYDDFGIYWGATASWVDGIAMTGAMGGSGQPLFTYNPSEYNSEGTDYIQPSYTCLNVGFGLSTAISSVGYDSNHPFFNIGKNKGQNIPSQSITYTYHNGYCDGYPSTFVHFGVSCFLVNVGGTNESYGAFNFTGAGATTSHCVRLCFRPILTTPTISISGNTLTISPVQHAEGYKIYVDGLVKGRIMGTSVELANLFLEEGEYNIQVKAVASGFPDSDFSNTETYIVE